jgi:hypothetical protein
MESAQKKLSMEELASASGRIGYWSTDGRVKYIKNLSTGSGIR